MREPLEPGVIAALDQGDAYLLETLDTLTLAVRIGIEEAGATQTVCDFTALFAQKWTPHALACLLATALRERAELAQERAG